MKFHLIRLDHGTAASPDQKYFTEKFCALFSGCSYFLATMNAETNGLVDNDLFMAAGSAMVDMHPIIAAARAKCVIIGQPTAALRTVGLEAGRFYRR
jgi:hypothetical protein